jgi:probable rRNA maturation factor
MPALSLSLQFGHLHDDLSAAQQARHRAALRRHSVQRWLRHALLRDAQLTVRLVGDSEGQALNQGYRSRGYATNVLTFAYTTQPLVTADLVLCAPVVAREAKEQGRPLAAHYAHLLVHGALHAQGYDHETNEADAQDMEALEVRILAALGLPNPYR